MIARPDGVMAVAIGLSRCGKSTWVLSVIQNDKRVLAFDPKGEYATKGGFVGITDRREWIETLWDCGAGEGRFCFIGFGKDDYDFFCRVAFEWNKFAMCTVVGEELAGSTQSGKAAGWWGRLVTQGLGYGLKIVGTVQRGQEVDKSVMNNALFLHVMQHGTDDDAEYIAKKLGVDVEAIPRKKLQFIQWNPQTGIICAGETKFGAANKTWPKGAPRFINLMDGNKTLKIGNDLRFTGVDYK